MTIYLTLPSFENPNKLLDKKVNGSYIFSDITLKYEFTEVLCELDITLSLPAKVKISVHYFTNDKAVESKFTELNVGLLLF